MSEPRDDDALSWGGDDDPTLAVGRAAAADDVSAPVTELPDGYTAVGKGSDAVAREPDGAHSVTTEHSAQSGNAALVTLGILVGVYILFTLGWVLGGLRLQAVAPALLVSPAAYVPFFWLAVLVPAIWFGTTMLLTRRSARWVRFSWLFTGAVLLVPWPFIMIGVVGR